MNNYNNYKIERIVNGEMFTNSYFIISLKSNKAIIIDPADYNAISNFIKNNALIPEYIFNTHGHYDHISGNKGLKENFDIPIYINAKDSDYLSNPHLNLSAFMGKDYCSPKADVLVYDGMHMNFDGIDIVFYDIPGHSPGSTMLRINNNIISGDLIFTNGFGRTDLPHGDIDKLNDSIRFLFSILNDRTMIYPGHGDFGKKEQFNNFDINNL